MKNILFFDHTANLGGGEIALLRLVSALNRKRFNPVVLLAAEGRLQSLLANASIETHILPLDDDIKNRPKETIGFSTLLSYGVIHHCFAYARRMAAIIQSLHIDLLHTNSLKADLLGTVAARIARIPVIWHVRDRIASDYLPSPATIGFRKLCRFLPDHIIANSNATLQTLGPTMPRATMVYDGMPVSLEPRTRSIPDTPPVIGLIGRISPWKGQDVFIKSAKLVLKRFPAVRFRIIGAPMFGEEPYERELRQLAANLGLSHAVEFAGFKENIQEQIEQLSIVVHASTIAEPFGQVIFEAMYYSKPVIATNGGGVPEIIENQKSGILVPMGDEHATAAAITSLLENPCIADRMGIEGHERILKHFTINQTARKVEAIYNNILG